MAEERSIIDEMSNADQAMGYNELIQDDVWKGELSVESILEGLTEQFENYINTEDKTNYVDEFFKQYHLSLNTIRTDDADDHPEERNEILSGKLDEFISAIGGLFKQRLNITVIPIDDESSDIDEIESILRKLYEFFILHARNNFITVISGDINQKINGIDLSDNREFVNHVRSMSMEYNPIITTISVNEFLGYTKQNELVEMLESGKWSGNFLKKYSPKLYQNDDLVSDIITNVAIIMQLKGGISHGNG